MRHRRGVDDSTCCRGESVAVATDRTRCRQWTALAQDAAGTCALLLIIMLAQDYVRALGARSFGGCAIVC